MFIQSLVATWPFKKITIFSSRISMQTIFVHKFGQICWILMDDGQTIDQSTNLMINKLLTTQQFLEPSTSHRNYEGLVSYYPSNFHKFYWIWILFLSWLIFSSWCSWSHVIITTHQRCKKQQENIKNSLIFINFYAPYFQFCFDNKQDQDQDQKQTILFAALCPGWLFSPIHINCTQGTCTAAMVTIVPLPWMSYPQAVFDVCDTVWAFCWSVLMATVSTPSERLM